MFFNRYQKVLYICVTLIALVTGFFSANVRIETSKTVLYGTNYEDIEFDPYSDLLNMEKIIEPELNNILVSEVTLDKPKNSPLIAIKNGKEKSKRVKPWVHWDEFMESEFGDMDAELKESDMWMLELRDSVELKRGMAIWSKRSDEEIQREMKKHLASKSLKIPEVVSSFIRCVHLERSHTMRQMRAENELGAIEFRKWMIEQKKKTKKDPLVQAKLEVSKKWLIQHPSKYSGVDQALVVMDERTSLSPNRMEIKFEAEKAPSGTS